MNETMLQSLTIMWQGMAGIFAFMLIFFGIITALNKVFTKKKDQ